jgi:hypothetical protein
MSGMDQLDTETRTTETAIRHALALLKHKEKILLEKEEYREYLEPPGEYKEEMMAIVKLLDELRTRFSVVSRDERGIRPTEESVSRRYRVRLVCEAEMKNLLGFMYEVEGSRKLLEIESWTVEPKERGSKIVSCTMVIARTVILD